MDWIDACWWPTRRVQGMNSQHNCGFVFRNRGIHDCFSPLNKTIEWRHHGSADDITVRVSVCEWRLSVCVIDRGWLTAYAHEWRHNIDMRMMPQRGAVIGVTGLWNIGCDVLGVFVSEWRLRVCVSVWGWPHTVYANQWSHSAYANDVTAYPNNITGCIIHLTLKAILLLNDESCLPLQAINVFFWTIFHLLCTTT